MGLSGNECLLPHITLITDIEREEKTMEDEKIIQIMPAPSNGYVKHKDEKGYFFTKIVGMALTQYGDVVFLSTDDFGDIALLQGGEEVIFQEEPPKDKYNEM